MPRKKVLVPVENADIPIEVASAPSAPPEIPAATGDRLAVTPSDAAITLEALIDLRFRDLLNMCANAKDLTAALTAGTKWEAVKRKQGDSDSEEWGSGLGGNQ